MTPIRIANFALHDQSKYLQEWLKLGIELDPTPRAPEIDFNDPIWSEELVLSEVIKRLVEIKEEGFAGILIGGLSNVMAYAWYIAYHIGLSVVMVKTLRKRDPNGRFEFEFGGCIELLTPPEVLEIKERINLTKEVT